MKLLDEKAVSAEYGIALPTLRGWRVRGNGPPFFKIGSSVRYRAEDIERWLEGRRRMSTSATEPPADEAPR